ncbi:MAG: DegT/DnrJ/EryC1/StrS family aminotransferase [Spirochaetes bacterium]|nr:DegT/DnrJ/EryC1/StrS family aminotransferase [Spirochaetota bacterium]
MQEKKIPFSPPDISSKEIKYVKKTLKSGWITTGPSSLKFEEKLASYCNVDHAIALSSATSAMELVLRMLDIKDGDEVITSPYTYTATANVICHRRAKPVFVDVEKDSFQMDLKLLESAINKKTKVIMPVDFGGVPERFDEIKEICKKLGREDIVILADSAHSFGSKYKNSPIGSQADFHCFSFHAVKNLTTAEGGATVFNKKNLKTGLIIDDQFHKKMKIYALHGQSKDAMAKLKPGAWEYDIITDGFKCNMTDIMASLGIAQLERFDSMIEKRRKIHKIYIDTLAKYDWAILPFYKDKRGTESNFHLFPLRIKGFSLEQRNQLISKMAEKGIATNVHFIPLPMFSFYKSIGYKIEDYPSAFEQFKNEISLPIYSTLKENDARFVVCELVKLVEKA